MKIIISIFLLATVPAHGQSSQNLSGVEDVAGGRAKRLNPGGSFLILNPGGNPSCIKISNNSKHSYFVPLDPKGWGSFYSAAAKTGNKLSLSVDTDPTTCN